MKLIITALRQEARPLIEALGLKQDPACRKIPVYSSSEMLLAISGIGKLYGAIAATYAIHLAGKSGDIQLINVGMCGAVIDQIALGEAVTVHKIWDHASGREFFPDMLIQYPLQEAALGTFDYPVTTSNRPILSCDIVDMEASGIFQAAHLFLAPHQMLFLKVVTDYLEYSSEDYAQMLRYYEQSIEDWLPLLQDASSLGDSVAVISAEQESLLNSLADSMRLTRTQTHQLREAATRFLVRGGRDLQSLVPNLPAKPRHKSLRNQMFESMIRALNR